MRKTKACALVVLVALLASLFAGAAYAASVEPSQDPSQEISQETTVLVEENIEDLTAASYGTLTANSTRSSTDTGHLYVGYDIIDNALVEAESNWSTDDVQNIVLNNYVVGEGFTAVRANNSQLTISGSLKTSSGGAQGEFASDFTGTGAAVIVNGGSEVTVENLDFESEGFVRAFGMLYGAANVSTVLRVIDSDIVAYGADPLTEAYDGYYNSAQTTMMLSSPWVLGIQGGIRTINVLGTRATFIAQGSYIAAGGWGVVSTDGCTAPRFWVIDTTLEILSESEGGMNAGADILGYEDIYGSGYGTFLIGSSDEHFLGTTFEGTTYASILNGGTAEYLGLVAGESYELTDAYTEEVIEVYTAEETIPTVINSVFGVTAQNSGTIKMLSGVDANVEEALFLYRSGTGEWIIDGADIDVSSGVILQMMDNDDSTIGGFNPFNTYLYEASGLATEAYTDGTTYTFTTDTVINPAKTYYQATEDGYEVVENPTDEGTVAYLEKGTGGSQVTLSLANGEYDGDVFNGTGYYNQASDALTVTIEDSATLNGDIALTSHFHGISLEGRDVAQVVEAIEAQNARHEEIGGYYEGLEDIQYEFLNADFEVCGEEDAAYVHFTQFAIPEYFLLGQVENAVYYNGLATVDVIVNGTWVVEEESLVTYLEIAEGASVYGELVENEDGSLTILPSEDLIPAGEYGSAFFYVASASSSSSEMASGEASGEMTTAEASGEMTTTEAAAEETVAEASAEIASGEM